MTIKERFWSKTRVNEGHEWNGTPCVDWTASKHDRGYGSFSVNGTMRKAHRVAFEWANGEIPEGLFVCHRCDRPCCVNPDHLFLGTHQDNMKDMKKKGRAADKKGELHGACKITEGTVRLIKRFIERHPPRMGGAGGQLAFLSRWLGVTRVSVKAISRGQTWRHVK